VVSYDKPEFSHGQVKHADNSLKMLTIRVTGGTIHQHSQQEEEIMKNRKRLFLVALAGLVVLAFLGCNRPSSSTSSSTASGSTEKKEMSLWTWKIAMTPGFEAAAELFRQKTGYTITVEAYSPDDTYRQKVLSAANSGDLPDLIHWWASRQMNFENVLVDFTQKADAAYQSQFAATSFNNSIVRPGDVTQWQANPEASNVLKALKAGDIHHIPVDVGGAFTVYANNEILEKVGLANKVPDSYEQLLEYMIQVKNGTDKAGFVFSNGLPDVYYNWFGRAVEANYLGLETSVALRNREAKMNDPKNIIPLKAWETLCKSGVILDGVTAMNIDEGDMAFASGRAAFLLGGTYTFGQLTAMGMDVTKVFSFVVPKLRNSVITEPFGINPSALTGMAIPITSKHQDAAWDYIQFIALDPEGIVAFANGAYVLPAAKLDDKALSTLTPALQAQYKSLTDRRTITSQVDDFPDIIVRNSQNMQYVELYKDMQKILTGEMTAEQVAAEFDRRGAEQKAAGRM
jgi:multiple sugar transport system substrate-binding protein